MNARLSSVNACFRGVHPEGDRNREPWRLGTTRHEKAGTPLCGGRVRIIVVAITGDLGFLGNELKYPHFNSNAPCMFCPVRRNRGHLLTDCRRGAEWKTLVREYVGLLSSPPIPELIFFQDF